MTGEPQSFLFSFCYCFVLWVLFIMIVISASSIKLQPFNSPDADT